MLENTPPAQPLPGGGGGTGKVAPFLGWKEQKWRRGLLTGGGSQAALEQPACALPGAAMLCQLGDAVSVILAACEDAPFLNEPSLIQS